MRARVDAALTLDAREMPPKVVERLCRMLSFPNPAFLDRLRLGLNPGAELETVCFVGVTDDYRHLLDTGEMRGAPAALAGDDLVTSVTK